MHMNSPTLQDQIVAVPDRTGVYIFHSADGDILYIGKAKSLRSRVKSYFRSNMGVVKTEDLVRRVASVDTIVVGTEAEA